MHTKLGIVVVLSVAVLVSACGSSPENLIVGKWEAGQTGLKLTAEFAKDGTAKITMFGKTVPGTYKIDGDELEWTMNGKTTKSKVKVTSTDLELTSDGKTIKYKRL